MLNRIKAWDESVLVRLLNKRTPKLNKAMVLFTKAGDRGRVWFAFSIPFIIMNKFRVTGFAMLLAMAFAFVGGEITIKHIVGRVRPCNKNFENNSLIKNP